MADVPPVRYARSGDVWVDFFETNYRVDGEIDHTRDYLLVVGTRR